MRALFRSDSKLRWCQQSQRVTRETPSASIVFHPVSSQIGQGTDDGNRSGGSERTRPPLTVEVRSPYFELLAFGLSASCGGAGAGGLRRTRSVGGDFPSAGPRRCSQASMPRGRRRLAEAL